MMHMTFYWGKSVTILFDSWKTDSWLSYALSLVACFLFSVFYQYMEDRRIQIRFLSNKPLHPSGINAPLLNWKPDSLNRRSAAAVLFVINSAIGYLLMLAVMSFNGGVFLAIVLGLGVGYFVFRGGEGEVVVVDSPCACA